MQDFSVRLTPGLTEYKPFFSGCGTGQSTFILSKYFDRVLGVDVSESQIKEARDPLLHLHLQFTNTSENRKRKKKILVKQMWMMISMSQEGSRKQ